MLSKEKILPIAILVEGPLDPNKIYFQKTESFLTYPPEALEYIRLQWQERLKTGRSTRDSDVTAFEGVNRTGEGLVILGSPTKFSIRNGSTQSGFREKFGDGLVTKTIGVNALLRTADDYILVGQRNTYRRGKEGGLHMVGGYLEGDDSLTALNDEVSQETGILENEWVAEKLLGITQSKETLSVDISFYGRTSLTKSDIKTRSTDDELGRVFLPDTFSEIEIILLKFLPTASTTVIGALYLYGKQSFGMRWAERVLQEMAQMQGLERDLRPEFCEARMHSLARMLKNYQ